MPPHLRVLSQTESLLAYERYIKLQSSLRFRRRELLLFCQHPPTLTAGLQAQAESLLLALEELHKRNILHIKVGRGGDYTAHEPGQLLIYPHIDLRKRKLRIHDYVEALLKISIQTLEEIWDIQAFKDNQRPGLYCKQKQRKGEQTKIASIGIMCKAFFSSFGLALNVSNSLSTFAYINPCGYKSLELASVGSCGADVEKLNSFIDLWQKKFINWLILLE